MIRKSCHSVRKDEKLVHDLGEYSLDMLELIVYESNVEVKIFPF